MNVAVCSELGLLHNSACVKKQKNRQQLNKNHVGNHEVGLLCNWRANFLIQGAKFSFIPNYQWAQPLTLDWIIANSWANSHCNLMSHFIWKKYLPPFCFRCFFFLSFKKFKNARPFYVWEFALRRRKEWKLTRLLDTFFCFCFVFFWILLLRWTGGDKNHWITFVETILSSRQTRTQNVKKQVTSVVDFGPLREMNM